MAVEFLSPYEADKVLSGVLTALPVQRPNWLQTFFSGGGTTEKETVNFDQEYSAKNTMGMFVSPKADVTPIQLNDFGTKELRFGYAKEGLNSDDYEQLNVRQLGQQFGTVNVIANEALRLRQKLILAEQRFENLFEKAASHIILYGGYEAYSEKHPRVRYDFGRAVVTSFAALLGGGLAPSVNLTTSAVTAPWDSSSTILPVLPTAGAYTSGEKAWTKALVDAGTAKPVEDLALMVKTANARAGVAAVQMSSDAYSIFNYDVNKNYKDAANNNYQVITSTQLDLIPKVGTYRGLTFQRFWTFENGISVPIYTYEGIYHDRVTGAQESYVGSGWVNCIPPANNGVKIYGRIMHPRAQWQAMPRWMNYWENSKTGEKEWEVHTNFLMGHVDIDSVVSWKVI